MEASNRARRPFGPERGRSPRRRPGRHRRTEPRADPAGRRRAGDRPRLRPDAGRRRVLGRHGGRRPRGGGRGARQVLRRHRQRHRHARDGRPRAAARRARARSRRPVRAHDRRARRSTAPSRAMEYGALRYLIKPVEPAELEEVVARAVRLHQMARSSARRWRCSAWRASTSAIGPAWRRGSRRAMADALDRLPADRVVVAPVDVRVRGAGPQRGADAALAARSVRGGGAAGTAAGAGARRPRSRGAHAGRSSRSTALLFINLHAMELDDDSLISADAPLSRHAARVVLEVTERAPLEKIRDVTGAGRAAARARLPHRGRRSGRRLRRADQLRAPRARGGEGRHVADPRHRPLADEAEAAGLDRGLCRDLGIEIIAEGIETEAERDALVAPGRRSLPGLPVRPPRQALGRDQLLADVQRLPLRAPRFARGLSARCRSLV